MASVKIKQLLQHELIKLIEAAVFNFFKFIQIQFSSLL